jgi:hypothetical protein
MPVAQIFLFLAAALVITLTNSAIFSARNRLHTSPPHFPAPYPPYASADRPALPHWPASAPARLDGVSLPAPSAGEKKRWLRFW